MHSNSSVLHGGVLRKRGDYLNSWRERYFELLQGRVSRALDCVSHHAQLVYYKEWRAAQKPKHPDGLMILDPASTTLEVMIDDPGINLCSGRQIFRLMALSFTEQRIWARMLINVGCRTKTVISDDICQDFMDSNEYVLPRRVKEQGCQCTDNASMQNCPMISNNGQPQPNAAGNPHLCVMTSSCDTRMDMRASDTTKNSSGSQRQGKDVVKRKSVLQMLMGLKSTSGFQQAGKDNSSKAIQPFAYLEPLQRSQNEIQRAASANVKASAQVLQETYVRAVEYVEAHKSDLPPQEYALFKGWQNAQEGPEAIAAQAMYLLELGKWNSGWAKAHSQNANAGPQEAIARCRRWPHPKELAMLKERLDFSGPEWTELYLKLEGSQLLQDILATHLKAADQGYEEAHMGVLATVECIHSLLSTRLGLKQVLEDRQFMLQLCAAISIDDIDTIKLLLDILSRICISSLYGQEGVLRGFLQNWEMSASSGDHKVAPSISGPARFETESSHPGTAFAYNDQQSYMHSIEDCEKAAPPVPPPPPRHLPSRVGKSSNSVPPPPPPPLPNHICNGTQKAPKSSNSTAPPLPPPLPAHLQKGARNGLKSAVMPPAPPPPPHHLPTRVGISANAATKPPPPPPPPAHLPIRTKKETNTTTPSQKISPPPVQRPTLALKASSTVSVPSPPPLPAHLPTRAKKASDSLALPPVPPPPPTHIPIRVGGSSHTAAPVPPLPPPPPPPPGHLPSRIKKASITANSLTPACMLRSELMAPSSSSATPVSTCLQTNVPEHTVNQPDEACTTSNHQIPTDMTTNAANSDEKSKPPSRSILSDPTATTQIMISASNEIQKSDAMSGCKQSQKNVTATLSVENFANLFTVADASSYDHDLLVSALLLLHALLEGHGHSSPNRNLQTEFVLQLRARSLLVHLADLQQFGDSYVRIRAQQCQVMFEDVLKLLEPKPIPVQKTGQPKAPVAAPPPPPPPPKPRLPVAPRAPAHVPPRVPPGRQPSVKMKNFFWDKIPDNRVENTFWDTHPPSTELDWTSLEKLFQAPQRTRKLKGKTDEISGPKKLAVLELKRATGIGIRMARLPVPWSDVRKGILTCDDRVLRYVEDVETLLACVPSDEETRMLEAYIKSGGKLHDLSEAEMFALDLSQVPRCEARLRTFQHKFTALETLQEAKEVLEGHTAAAKEMQCSKSFADVLQVALGAGNFLNWGTARGQAAGFRLRGLNKLQDTRSLDGQTSLLKYLADATFDRYQSKTILSDELPNVTGNALKIPLSEVSEMLEMVTTAMHDCHHELCLTPSRVLLQLEICDQVCEEQRKVGVHDETRVRVHLHVDSYNEIMTRVCEAVHQQQEEIQVAYDEARSAFAEVVEFFGDNVSSLASEADFWNDIITFVTLFSANQRKCMKAQDAEEERLLRKAQKIANLQEANHSSLLPKNPSSFDKKSDEDGLSVLDLDPIPVENSNSPAMLQHCRRPNTNSAIMSDRAETCNDGTVEVKPATKLRPHVSSRSEESDTFNAGGNVNMDFLVDKSVACLPLSSFKPDNGVSQVIRRRLAPLSERSLNSNDRGQCSAESDSLQPLSSIKTSVTCQTLAAPECTDSPLVPTTTIEQDKTPIPHIASRFADLKEPAPRASAVLWATADSNPIFGMPPSPSGYSDDMSCGSLTFSSSPSTERDGSSSGAVGHYLNRSVTSLSPLHGRDQDCSKCKSHGETGICKDFLGDGRLSLGTVKRRNSTDGLSPLSGQNLLMDDRMSLPMHGRTSSTTSVNRRFSIDNDVLGPQSYFMNRPSLRLRASLQVNDHNLEFYQPPFDIQHDEEESDGNRTVDPTAPGMGLLANLGLVRTNNK